MRSIAIIGALATLAAAPLSAQGKFRTGDIIPGGRIPSTVMDQIPTRDQQDQRSTRKSDRIPPGHMPPAGMCRIWIDGVPPGRQPAPTDCQTAVATKPANARVIWGDQSAFPGKGKGKFKKTKGHHDRDDDFEDRRRGRDEDFDRDRRRGRDDDDDDDRNEARDRARNGGVFGSMIPSATQQKSISKGKGKSKGKGRG